MSTRDKKNIPNFLGGQPPSIRDLLHKKFVEQGKKDFNDDEDGFENEEDFHDFDDDDFDMPPRAPVPPPTSRLGAPPPMTSKPEMPMHPHPSEKPPSTVPQRPVEQKQSSPLAKEADGKPSPTGISHVAPSTGHTGAKTALHANHQASVRVSCVLGDVQLSVNEIANLKEGHVMDFHQSGQFVRIDVNGVPLGDGILVDVKGRLGVKIIRWVK